MIDVAVHVMTLPERARGGLAALISVLVHVLVLMLLAATTIHIAAEDRQMIPLVIRNPAPPPPPPGPGGVGPAASAAEVVAPVEPPKVVPEPHPVAAPHPAERMKIAARTKPKKEDVARQPTPAPAEPPAAVASAPAAPVDEAAGGGSGGVAGGVAGGQVGGKVGGRLGGTGDDVWSLDQVAVPPKVLEPVRPDYPTMAREHGQEGIVVVQAVIDRRGRVETDALHVIQSHPPFDDAAIAAFRQWKFAPGRNGNGEVVRVLVQQPIRFQLR